jgi:beta-galactosidase
MGGALMTGTSSRSSPRLPGRDESIWLGVAYYPENEPVDRVDDDIRLMRDAHITFVRMGDASWSLCEPAEGRFEFGWLERTLDRLHAAGIKAILATPTFAIPAWLARLHPEIMAVYEGGEHGHYGGRQNFDFTHPAYRHFAERVVRRMLQQVGRHPAVAGFQLDNETGTGLLFNPSVQAGFREHLQRRYRSVEELNDRWGLVYWSHRLSSWDDLWPAERRAKHGPGMSGNTVPGLDLEWRRYQASLTTEFLAWLAAIVREHARPDQFITHNFVGSHGRDDAARHEIGRVVDIAGEDPYYATQDALQIPTSASVPAAPEWMGEVGAWSLTFKADIGRMAQQRSFLVLESNALTIGDSAANYPAYTGQWRLAAYTFIARGATAIGYWQWYTNRFGHETYWGGILGHDLRPNRSYREIAALGSELALHAGQLAGLDPEAEVAFLYSPDSRYALQFKPCLTLAGSRDPDPRSYERVMNAMYEGFFHARAQSTILDVRDAEAPGGLERFPVVVAPALYIASETLLQRLIEYAEGGGHLVITIRSGYADEDARVRPEPAPGILGRAAGIHYDEYSNLANPLEVRSLDPSFSVSREARADAWIDGVAAEAASPLVGYAHHHFGRFPAVTTAAQGQGRVTYVGTLPNVPLATDLAGWVLRASAVTPRGAGLPEQVRVSGARCADGRRALFYSNWSNDPARIPVPAPGGDDLLAGRQLHPGDPLDLGPWDVRVVLCERDGQA